jgi:predicted regulator of Ras-like GTPase activity (Roadblock/LC7/MglB family)
MQDLRTRTARLAAIAAVGIAAIVTAVLPAAAQNPQVEEKLAALKQSISANKQAIAQYTWQEVETISVKGEVKDTKTYQVQMGPNGQAQKTEVSNDPAQQSGREGRLKKRVVTHVKDEYQQYGEQIAALAKQYAPPSASKLQSAYKQGNVSLDLGGASGTVSLVIKNYVKPNDSMTLVFNQAAKAIESVRVVTYLTDPKDAVTISAQFAQIPGGPNHVASTLVNGVSKQLTVSTQNANYQRK